MCPGEGDLIGFVTTGGYDLGAGRGRGVGCLAVRKVLGFGRGGGGEEEGGDGKEGGGKEEGKRAGEMGVGVNGLKRENRFCVVRDAGQSVGRLARWEFV